MNTTYSRFPLKRKSLLILGHPILFPLNNAKIFAARTPIRKMPSTPRSLVAGERIKTRISGLNIVSEIASLVKKIERGIKLDYSLIERQMGGDRGASP